MSLIRNASRPQGGPAKPKGFVGRGGARKRSAGFADRRKRSEAYFATTRRMPSDAVAALWLEELEGLE